MIQLGYIILKSFSKKNQNRLFVTVVFCCLLVLNKQTLQVFKSMFSSLYVYKQLPNRGDWGVQDNHGFYRGLVMCILQFCYASLF